MKMKKKRSVIKTLVVVIVIGVVIGGLWAGATVLSAVKELPRPEQITSFQPTQSTKIYDRTGEVLLYEIHGDQSRTVIPSEEIPLHVKQATIAIEDQKFYEHSGFSISGYLRAAWINIISGGTQRPGGSTLTQQLVKNVFLNPEKTIKRKIKELVLAYWIEQRYSKDEILSLYLNQVSYGSNAYGIQSAAQTFFGKDAKNLSLSEAAYLASMLQAPSYYSPWGSHTEELAQRKNYVLSQMNLLGFIDDEEKTRAQEQEVPFLEPTLGSIRAPHFVMMVRQYLEEKYGNDVLENGGLKVVTTLDWKLQEVAERVVKEGAERNTNLYNGTNASMVVQDPKTGQILSLVGSADYFNKEIDGQFNVAVQGLRQPGSTFKPFAYLTAFMKGYTPDTIVFDTPTEFSPNNPSCPVQVDFSSHNSSCFHPHNFDGIFRGPVSLKQALAQSINIPAVKTLYLAGLSNTLSTAESMGITTLTDPSRYGLSLVLGGGEVRLVDLVNAYSVFAQEGVRHNQSFLTSVTDQSGVVLEEYKDVSTEVLQPQYARMITNILSDVELRSGLFQSSLSLTTFDGYDVALKTGTTNDYRDAWIVGYTPFLTVGVWAGNSNYEPMVQQGGSILAALPIWSAFFKEVINDYPPETFTNPEPTFSSQSMLNGEYIITDPQYSSPQVHTILYYLDKDNPQDLVSSIPHQDPQFYNWEVPVIEWAQEHIPDFISDYNLVSSPSSNAN